MPSREHDERVAAVLARVARIDPALIAAADDQDVTLIRWALAQSPLERLRSCTNTTRMLFRFRRDASEAG